MFQHINKDILVDDMIGSKRRPNLQIPHPIFGLDMLSALMFWSSSIIEIRFKRPYVDPELNAYSENRDNKSEIFMLVLFFTAMSRPEKLA